MKLTLPEGFTPPNTARPGETFEVVATLKPSEDGSFSLVALDGVKLEEEDEVEEPEEMDRTDSTNIRLPFEEDED